jgi:short-subunit dehydrogenase
MQLAGSTAIVTGRAIALGFADEGASVVLVARRRERLAEVAAACAARGVQALPHAADVDDPQACMHVVATALERFGAVDVLVNNAGVSLHRHAVATSADDVEAVMRTNFLGAVRLTTAALPGMLDRGRGSVVSITSVAGYIPNPREAAYGASKAALSLWSHGLAVDLHGTGVRVGVVSPGPIDTEIWEKEAAEALYRGRLHPPEVVARAVLDVVRGGAVHRTVPRRYGLLGALYPVAGRPIRTGLVRFARGAGGRR